MENPFCSPEALSTLTTRELAIRELAVQILRALASGARKVTLGPLALDLVLDAQELLSQRGWTVTSKIDDDRAEMLITNPKGIA